MDDAMIDGVVIDALNHDGTLYTAGMPITLPEATFAQLEAAGVVSREVAAASAIPASAAKVSAEDLRGMVMAVIGQLEPSAFAEDGAPKRSAIQAALPKGTKGVTDALVADIWAGLKHAA
jgi:hypothetical protein